MEENKHMKVTLSDDSLNIGGVEVRIPYADPEFVPSEVILLVRSVGISPDGSRSDALDYWYSDSTTGMLRKAILNEALEIEAGDYGYAD